MAFRTDTPRDTVALDALAQAFHRSRSLLTFYLELAGDFWLAEQVAATVRSTVCCFWRSDDALSTDAFRQFCIAVCRVLLQPSLSGPGDRCPSLQFHTGGRGVRLPPGPPFGAQLSRALRGLCDLTGARSDARTTPSPMHCSRIDRVLFAISSRRLLIFSSTAHDDLELSRHLQRNVHTFASAHIARGRERGDRERATRRFCLCRPRAHTVHSRRHSHGSVVVWRCI